jgi:trans-aconitate methyltransferase
MAQRYGDVLFAPSHGPAEVVRLRALATTFDPASRHRLEVLGVAPGMRCLDVGAGTGTVTEWLACRVGPTGSVVAQDKNPWLLEPLQTSLPNVSLADGDVTEPETLPKLGRRYGRFDLIHARFVMMFLPERLAVLQNLRRLLAPGGVLVLSDSIDLTTSAATDDTYRRVMAATWLALRASIGGDISWVLGYPRMLLQQGLRDVGVDVYLPSLDATSPAVEFWWRTWQQLREPIVATGLVGDRDVDDAIAALNSRRFAEISAGMITSWGRTVG